MNRREFGKLLAAAVLVPSLITLSNKEAKLPAKMRYRGFDCLVSDADRHGFGVKQVYWSNGKYQNGLLVDRDIDWQKVEDAIKKNVDRYYKKKVA